MMDFVYNCLWPTAFVLAAMTVCCMVLAIVYPADYHASHGAAQDQYLTVSVYSLDMERELLMGRHCTFSDAGSMFGRTPSGDEIMLLIEMGDAE